MSKPEPSPTLVLASRSPRRRELLAAAGIACEVQPAPFDDADMRLFDPRPVAQAMALAYVKAAAVLASAPPHALVLGADTLCIVDGRSVGKPISEDHARRVLLDQVNRSHEVVSGVALLCVDPISDAPLTGELRVAGLRWITADTATVAWGEIPEDEIDRYVASGLWQGKAGGYNLFERIDAGWPITYEGDPATVMGLPMTLLRERLEAHVVPGGAVSGPAVP
ncbi:MAG: nucleoside triphosphate pyrophosphatase [Planctomycetota bacterium]